MWSALSHTQESASRLIEVVWVPLHRGISAIFRATWYFCNFRDSRGIPAIFQDNRGIPAIFPWMGHV
ncbi:hypothetical protein Taro_005500 [Colocasia esculenta]|uniref:Uncharacterized protein n=1 Tax=Colocasia esculenta TaxID=4460 RepID=A0A843TQ28_COLES|nr:hypothetical protein [Colocasia esculenta]